MSRWVIEYPPPSLPSYFNLRTFASLFAVWFKNSFVRLSPPSIHLLSSISLLFHSLFQYFIFTFFFFFMFPILFEFYFESFLIIKMLFLLAVDMLLVTSVKLSVCKCCLVPCHLVWDKGITQCICWLILVSFWLITSVDFSCTRLLVCWT